MIGIKEFMQLQLLEQGQVLILGEITGDTARMVSEAFLALNAFQRHKEIKLLIDSGGGSVDAGLDIFDIIRTSDIPVRAVVQRRACSMAAVVLQACHVRTAYENAGIVFHDTTGTTSVTNSHAEIDKALEHGRQNQEKIFKILAARMNKPMEEVKKFSRAEIRMTSYEAIDWGLLDEVIQTIPIIPE